jgi:hypothetical protein
MEGHSGMIENGWIWLRAGFMTVGVEVRNGTITEAPPICKYCIGWSPLKFKIYLKNRGILKDWLEYEECTTSQ